MHSENAVIAGFLRVLYIFHAYLRIVAFFGFCAAGNTLVHGTFYISGNYRNEYGEWDSCSLTDEQIEKYKQQFDHIIVDLPGIGLVAVRETRPEVIEPEETEFEQTL